MPSGRGRRVRVAPCLYKDDLGYAVVVSVGDGAQRLSREKRFPHATEFSTMKTWRDETRLALRQLARRQGGQERGSLAADVRRYLRDHCGVDFPETRAAELAAWVAEFGTQPRASLTTARLDACLHAWRRDRSATTCNHRRNALIQLFRALDGPDAPNPAEHTTHFRTETAPPREIPADALDELIGAMEPSKTRAFYRLMVETGWPPARIRRIEPEHVNWPARSVYLVDRRKGRGSAGKQFPLTARGLEAMREFQAANAWGGVTKQSIAIVFDRARLAVNRRREREGRPTLSAHLRPYDARATIGSQLVRRTGDIYGTAEFLGVTVQTALKWYTRAAVPDRMLAAASAIDDFRGAPAPPATAEAEAAAKAKARARRRGE